jgi:hypothetical protein
MTDKFNINRRKFISTGAALSLGFPLMGKTNAINTPAPVMQPAVNLNGETGRQEWLIAGWEIPD